MPLSDAQKQEFAKAIAAFVPEQMLAHVIRDHDIVKNFDEIGKSFAGPLEGRYGAIARTLIDRYDESKIFDLLAEELYHLMKWEPRFLTIIVPLMRMDDKSGQQAFLVQGDNMFVAQELEDALLENRPRICCIAGAYEIANKIFSPLGTGFLVGPDLILTARHVFEPLVAIDPERVPACFAVFFDHTKGEPILRPDDRRNGVRRVKLAADWRVAERASFPSDGRIDQPTPAQILEMKDKLDFALIRLAEKIGLETINSSGGARRAWVSLPPPGWVANLKLDRRIVIPQHPFGFQQSLDFGRFRKTCNSGTRIRYDTETAKGTSGAPCFNREFKLVGIHNAEFNPHNLPKAEANQAISFDVIDPIVRPYIVAPPAIGPAPAAPLEPKPALTEPVPPVAASPSHLWKLSEGAGNLRAIIGREKFLNWLLVSKATTVSDKAERIYAAVAPARGAGKTFTTEILAYSLAKEANHKALVFGTDQQLLPSDLGDLVRVLAIKLNVPAFELDNMPPRPDVNLPVRSVDGDKLRRWASVLVPTWFADVLERNRIFSTNRAEEARKRVDQIAEFNRGMPKELKLKVPKEMQALAASAIAIPAQHEHWRLAWIAIDNLSDTTMTSEVKDFLAAMAGAGRDEAGLPAVLRRLRWLYLGYRPDFLAEAEAVVETLDPTKITAADVQTLLKSAFAAAGRTAEAEPLTQFGEIILLAAAKLSASGLVDPAENMKQVQDFAGTMLPLFLPKGGGR